MELSVATPQVIARRVGRMLTAGPNPSRADHDEFMRMGAEKVHAFFQSWAAMWQQAGAAQLRALQTFWLSWPAGRGLSAASARRALSRQANAFTQVLDAGLAPLHSKAVSNARRLGRPSKPGRKRRS